MIRSADSRRGGQFAILATGFALAALILIFFVWLSEDALKHDMLRFDEQVRAAVHQHARPALTRLMIVASDVGSTPGLLLQVLLAAAYFWIRGQRLQAVFIALSISGAILLTSVLKIAFHRARPEPFFGLATPRSYSFPSGHALESFCVYAMLAHLLAPNARTFGRRVAIWTLASLVFLLIGFSRIYLGVHYPTDVIAGYAAGAVWIATLAVTEKRLVAP